MDAVDFPVGFFACVVVAAIVVLPGRVLALVITVVAFDDALVFDAFE